MRILKKLSVRASYSLNLIYKGNGVDETSLVCLRNVLAAREGERTEVFESLDDRKLGFFYQPRFFFPGGVCSEWDRAISRESLNIIRSSVESCSHYVGTCAGAYFGCRQVLFNMNSEYPIVRTRKDLSFFNGAGVGPLLENNTPGSGGRAQLKFLIWKDGTRTPSIVYGGGYFVPSKLDIEGQTYEVLAHYEDEPPHRSAAVIRCFVGDGRATLSFPHIEWGYEDLQSLFCIEPGDQWDSILEAFRESSVKPRDIFTKILA